MIATIRRYMAKRRLAAMVEANHNAPATIEYRRRRSVQLARPDAQESRDYRRAILARRGL